MALIIWGGTVGSLVLMGIVSLGMLYEYANIVLAQPDQSVKRYVLLGHGLGVFVAALLVKEFHIAPLLVCFLTLFIYFLIQAQSKSPEDDLSEHFKELVYCVFGMVYLVFLPLFFVSIRAMPFGMHWAIVFLLINWACDTGAYFVGKKFGKHRLYPLISPKKTWEGAIGGTALSIGVALGYKALFIPHFDTGALFVVATSVAILAQIGDLCESFLKRAFQVKDSGSILPGHGGFLDRFDGIVFSLPVMYAGIELFS